ncbi:hypothetical protein D9Q98_003572 [Chlorella vulgaris]|uniref:Uncharacterized protein n=1 Tax=Chlorella vulgaris TaxID=3077 RepID=A0A9D4TU94_CHLVU|nr:hypothetical protein D9Q98_003572 [Chlorella vulgaris]
MQGAQVTEMVIFLVCIIAWALYTLSYFNLHSWMPRAFGRNHTYNNIWGQAMRIRETWARDLMAKAEDASGAALLAVQQMRNIIVACTLLVMGMAQIMGRLVLIMVSDSNLATIEELAKMDPMTGPTPSWAPAYVRVAVPFGATLVSLLCFAQAVRLAVHVGFQVRVIGVSVGKHAGERSEEEVLLEDGTVCMVQRCELFFTLGLRFLYLFIGTIFWVLGTTALLVSSFTVLLMLALSDIVIVPRRSGVSIKRVQSPKATEV